MATEELIYVRNTLNGEIARVRRVVLNNPHLAKFLVEVDEDAKPLKLATPTTAEEFVSRRKGSLVPKPKPLNTEDSTETEEG